MSNHFSAVTGGASVEDDRLSLLEVDTLIIYSLLDCQHNGRTTSACPKFKRPLRSKDGRWIERRP